MGPPKFSTTFRLTTPMGPAGQYLHLNVVELKLLNGLTNHEKGEYFLQLSLSALRELADLLENDRLSPTDKAIYDRAYTTGQRQYDELKRIRDQLLAQKKTLRRFLVNLFIRTEARRFYKISYRTFLSIRQTSEDLTRQLLPNKSGVPASENSREDPAQGHVSVCEENPREAVEGSLSVTDLPPNETIRGITVEAHNEEEEQEVFATLNRIQNSRELNDDDDDDDDSQTITPNPSRSRPPSPSPSCTVIWNNYYINQSVASFDSELGRATLNFGTDGAVRSSSTSLADTDQPPSQ